MSKLIWTRYLEGLLYRSYGYAIQKHTLTGGGEFYLLTHQHKLIYVCKELDEAKSAAQSHRGA